MTEKEMEFLKAIRAIVKKEISIQMEGLKHDVKKMITENATVSSSKDASALSFLYEKQVPTAPKPIKKKQYVRDSFLNDLLNETGPLNEAKTVSDFVSFDGNNNMTVTGVSGERIDTTKDEVKKVVELTQRNYSDFIKKMEKR